MTKAYLKKVVLQYLKKTNLCALATCWKNQSWSATVFFAYDNTFNLFFFSREDTRHCVCIAHNPIVSVAMHQGWVKGKMIQGLQFVGQAKKVAAKDLKKYDAIYKKRYPWAAEFPDHVLYMIKPREVHYIDQKRFGHFYRVRII